MPRKPSTDRVSRGVQSRNRILEHGIQTASEHGLEALTIGRMAAKLRMSKSGLFAHFGSKRNLQLAVIAGAREKFEEMVLQPATEEDVKGIHRLWRLCDLRLKNLEGRALPSGYFFTGVFMEYGGRSGAIPQAIRTVAKLWFDALQQSTLDAQRANELKSNPNAATMAFEINALLVGAYWAHLAGIRNAYLEARIAVLGLLRGWVTDRVPSHVFKSVNAWYRYLSARAKS